MKGAVSVSEVTQETIQDPNGLRIKRINGTEYVDGEQMCFLICQELGRMAKETRPLVREAQDARRIVYELCEGLGGEMEKCRADLKIYIEDIRRSRMAVVTEISQISSGLREVRQFFLGGDYKEEIERLRTFVELCERLEKLKASGFLDAVADTMLKLAVR